MLLADLGCNADWIRELARKKGAWANSPKATAAIRSASVRTRNQIERFLQPIMQCRVATRYERLAINYFAMRPRLNESAPSYRQHLDHLKLSKRFMPVPDCYAPIGLIQQGGPPGGRQINYCRSSSALVRLGSVLNYL